MYGRSLVARAPVLPTDVEGASNLQSDHGQLRFQRLPAAPREPPATGQFAGTQLYQQQHWRRRDIRRKPHPANSLVSPQARNLFQLLLARRLRAEHANGQLPNAAGVGLSNNYAGKGTGTFNSNQWDVRGDATLNQKVHIFSRFSRFTDTLAGDAACSALQAGPGLGIAGFGGVSKGANDSSRGGRRRCAERPSW